MSFEPMNPYDTEEKRAEIMKKLTKVMHQYFVYYQKQFVEASK